MHPPILDTLHARRGGGGFRTSRREFSTAGFLKRSFVSRISGPISRSIEPHDRSAQSARERTSSSIIIRTINESSLEMLRNEVILLRTLLLRRSSLLKLPCYYRSWILRSTRREGQENENLPNDFQPDPIYTPSNLDFDQEYTLIPTPWTPTLKSIAAYRLSLCAIRHGMRATNSCLEFKPHRSPHRFFFFFSSSPRTNST